MDTCRALIGFISNNRRVPLHLNCELPQRPELQKTRSKIRKFIYLFNMSAEAEPFLDRPSEDSDCEKLSEDSSVKSENKFSQYRRLIITIAFHLTLIFCYTVIGVTVIKSNVKEAHGAPNGSSEVQVFVLLSRV